MSAVRPALPFAFITSDYNYIPAYTLQAATTPANVEIGKYYYKPHVDDIAEELEEALSLGPAAAEEWSKGLHVRGKERMKVAENWERWEVKYQWWQSHQDPKRDPSAAPSIAPSTTSTLSQSRTSPQHQPPSPVIHAPIPAGKYRSVHSVARKNTAELSSGGTPPAPDLTAVATASAHVQTRSTTIPPPGFTPQPIPSGIQPPRGERNLHDANEAKANRKLEIERRAQLLDPPIPPNVLRHMESFKAAIQISQPMNDYAWSMLQPRLLAQLPAAQQTENELVSRVASHTSRAADRRQQDANLKEVKEVLDREWEESQGPIRDRLGAIADDFINQDWDHGRAVTYENSPKFAVDLLMYVRRKFYAELSQDPSPAPFNPDSTETASSTKPRLVLDNMKWVYDNKLKPLTENFRKELFLCYGNGCEGNTRFYGFEGIIQHFGAKHTNTFSVGNIVVAWREAEWPEETPFHPDPISVRHTYSNQPGYGTYHGGYTRPGTSTPHMRSHPPQPSPSQYGYGAHYNGPFAPPHAPAQTALGYDYTQPFGTSQAMGPPGHGPYLNGQGYMTSPALSSAAVVHSQMAQPLPSDSNGLPMQSNTSQEQYSTNLYDKQVSTIIEASLDIWKHTSGIKDLPNSLRIYVLLHRVISKFHIEFNHEPNLSHFIDALSNHEIPRALKHAPGLSCKACQYESSYASAFDYPARPEERRTYTALKLLSHFQAHHTRPQPSGYGQGPLPPPLDWKEDMIELPGDHFILGLIHAPGMDDDKLRMIAIVFPRLFPPPLPRIGVIANGPTAPSDIDSKDPGDTSRSGKIPGLSIEKSGPSSRASPSTDSPRPHKPSDDEYDPRRPALLSRPTTSTGSTIKNKDPEESGTADPRYRLYEEAQYYVGSLTDSKALATAANSFPAQLPQTPLDEDYARPREYISYAANPRIIRDTYSELDEYSGRRPLYREHEPLDRYDRDEGTYPAARGERLSDQDRRTFQARGYWRGPHPEYHVAKEPVSPEPAPVSGHAAADNFLREFLPAQPSTRAASIQEPVPLTSTNPVSAQPEPDDGSRYSPPPTNSLAAIDPSPVPTPQKALSTISNGSRYEERPAKGRQVPTPDSGGPRRTGYYRRREHIPSRYGRHMAVARDEPYARGASMSRSQSKRYERYEEQRRRIDEQETPHPKGDREYEPIYSRDASVDNGYPEDPYQASVRVSPREYIPIQDRVPPYSPPRYRRYAGSPEGPRAPPQMYLDQYGQPVEIIRVPRDPRAERRPYPPARYYTEREATEHFQYVSYDRPPPRHDGRPAEYVYYEERVGAEPPLSGRRPVFESDSEVIAPPHPLPPPPEIKVEGVSAAVPAPPEGV